MKILQSTRDSEPTARTISGGWFLDWKSTSAVENKRALNFFELINNTEHHQQKKTSGDVLLHNSKIFSSLAGITCTEVRCTGAQRVADGCNRKRRRTVDGQEGGGGPSGGNTRETGTGGVGRNPLLPRSWVICPRS